MEDEDDAYDGYELASKALATPAAGSVVKRPMTGRDSLATRRGDVLATELRPTSSFRTTSIAVNQPRPRTSAITSSGIGGSVGLDVLNNTANAIIPPFEPEPDPELKRYKRLSDELRNSMYKMMELGQRGDTIGALNEARQLAKTQRSINPKALRGTQQQPLSGDETPSAVDEDFAELSYVALMCAGDVACRAHKWNEAIRYYHQLSDPSLNLQDDKKAPILVNIARIHYAKGDLTAANKLWRKALDCLSSGHHQVGAATVASRALRIGVMHNIGQSFMLMGRFKQAMQYFGVIIHESRPSNGGDVDVSVFSASLHKMLCHFFLDEPDAIKKEFERMISLKPNYESVDYLSMLHTANEPLPATRSGTRSSSSALGVPQTAASGGGPPSRRGVAPSAQQKFMNAFHEEATRDRLAQWEKSMKSEFNRHVMLAAKLVVRCCTTATVTAEPNTVSAAADDDDEYRASAAAKAAVPRNNNAVDTTDVYDWCLEKVRAAGLMYHEVVNEMEINKAMAYLVNRDFQKTVDALKALEEQESESKLASAAATNLSFYYYCLKEYDQALTYAEHACQANRYNSSALVNRGSCLLQKGNVLGAVESFQAALAIDSTKIDAMFNLGLAFKQAEHTEQALDAFERLFRSTGAWNKVELGYILASICEELGEKPAAIHWLMQTIHHRQQPQILKKLGHLYDDMGDKSEAFKSYFEAYKVYAADIDVLKWLGLFFIDSQFPEKAIQYFEKAESIDPTNIMWPLMIGYCLRKTQRYQQALNKYKATHEQFPDNYDCLTFIVQLAKALHLTVDAEAYERRRVALAKIKEQAAAAATRNPTRMGSARSLRESPTRLLSPTTSNATSQQRLHSAPQSQQLQQHSSAGRRAASPFAAAGGVSFADVQPDKSAKEEPAAEETLFNSRPKTSRTNRSRFEVGDDFHDLDIDEILH